MAAKTTASNTKQPHSASVLGPQEVKVKEKERSDKKSSETKKSRKKSPLLSAAEKRSDKYRRLPLNQLVRPPRSQYNLLQEKYASDPWKVIVICMLLNLTKGDQVSFQFFATPRSLHECYLAKLSARVISQLLDSLISISMTIKAKETNLCCHDK
jgi:hypothetical protein